MNLPAFLDMIAFSEGTSTSPVTKDNGYDVIVTGVDGPEVFTDYSRHPFVARKPKEINHNGLYSTASGRYQFMLHDWGYYKMMLDLRDFGPAAQDKWATQLIRERGALPMIEAGDIEAAIKRCSNIWASLPGAGYGQPERKIAALLTAYTDAGGVLA